jgi:hypothetical protein
MQSLGYLREVFHEIGTRSVQYFGDLDPAGIRIPRLANAKTTGMGLRPVEPDDRSHQRLLELGREKAEPKSAPLKCVAQDLEWLKNIAPRAAAPPRSLAQEHVGWELLRTSAWHIGDTWCVATRMPGSSEPSKIAISRSFYVRRCHHPTTSVSFNAAPRLVARADSRRWIRRF